MLRPLRFPLIFGLGSMMISDLLMFLFLGDTLPPKTKIYRYDMYIYMIYVYTIYMCTENVWLEDDPFLLGVGLFRSKLLVFYPKFALLFSTSQKIAIDLDTLDIHCYMGVSKNRGT